MTCWELISPRRREPIESLAEIRAFRARVLYDGGRRPHFRTSEGSFTDCDRHDADAYHLLAREGSAIVGCVRLVPVPERGSCLTEELIGLRPFADMLLRLGVHRSDTLEGGRWIVDPQCRRGRLAVMLAAGGVAVARALGYELLCCPVGTATKQDRVLARLGLRAVPALPVIDVARFDDQLRVMYVYPTRTSTHFGALVDAMASELDLTGLRHVLTGRSCEACETNW